MWSHNPPLSRAGFIAGPSVGLGPLFKDVSQVLDLLYLLFHCSGLLDPGDTFHQILAAFVHFTETIFEG